MFLIYLAFAYAALIIASNFTSRVWAWFVSAAVAGIAMYFIITYHIYTLLYIVVGLLALLLIICLIKKHL